MIRVLQDGLIIFCVLVKVKTLCEILQLKGRKGGKKSTQLFTNVVQSYKSCQVDVTFPNAEDTKHTYDNSLLSFCAFLLNLLFLLCITVFVEHFIESFLGFNPVFTITCIKIKLLTDDVLTAVKSPTIRKQILKNKNLTYLLAFLCMYLILRAKKQQYSQDDIFYANNKNQDNTMVSSVILNSYEINRKLFRLLRTFLVKRGYNPLTGDLMNQYSVTNKRSCTTTLA